MDNKGTLNKALEFLKLEKSVFGDFLILDREILSTKKPNDNDAFSKKNESPIIFPEIQSQDLFTTDKDWQNSSTIDDLNEKIHNCQNCSLGFTRTKFVFGSGNSNADIMIIGEAPGADEDQQGLPFVGRAGQLLTKILESIGLSREEVYIGNIIKCRPPNNRQPLPAEVQECEPYLMKQIELIKPAFIIILGLTAADTLLKKKHKMADTRGMIQDYHGIKLMITYHPAALLRNPDLKRVVWEDMKLLRRLYDEYLGK